MSLDPCHARSNTTSSSQDPSSAGNALHAAARAGHIDVAKALVEKGGANVNLDMNHLVSAGLNDWSKWRGAQGYGSGVHVNCIHRRIIMITCHAVMRRRSFRFGRQWQHHERVKREEEEEMYCTKIRFG